MTRETIDCPECGGGWPVDDMLAGNRCCESCRAAHASVMAARERLMDRLWSKATPSARDGAPARSSGGG